jgi:hypothetical protein
VDRVQGNQDQPDRRVVVHRAAVEARGVVAADQGAEDRLADVTSPCPRGRSHELVSNTQPPYKESFKKSRCLGHSQAFGSSRDFTPLILTPKTSLLVLSTRTSSTVPIGRTLYISFDSLSGNEVGNYSASNPGLKLK